MILTLKINQKNESFHTVKFKRNEYIQILKKVNKIHKIKKIDEKSYRNMIEFICRCFGSKFTKRQLRDSIKKEDIITLCIKLMGEYEKQALEVANKSKLEIALSELN